MSPEAKRLFFEEEARHLRELVNIVARWPEVRAEIAIALLGSAVAACDSFGIDVEGFLVELRRHEPRPAVLVPPKSKAS